MFLLEIVHWHHLYQVILVVCAAFMAWKCSSVSAAIHCSQYPEDWDNDIFQREVGDTTDLEQNFEATNLRSADEEEDWGMEKAPAQLQD